MDKAQEIELLNRFIATCPAGSYLARWMADQAEFIAADIRNDIFPSQTPREAYAAGQKEIQLAEKRALEIIAAGEKRALQIVEQAQRDAEYKRQMSYRESRVAREAAQSFIQKLNEL